MAFENNTKKFWPIFISLFALIAIVGTAAAAPKKIIGHVSGTIRSSLPQLNRQRAPGISYAKPGEILVELEQRCGDGQAASYAKKHPSMEFSTSQPVDVVLGYWLTARGGGSMPTEDTWVPVAVINDMMPGTGAIIAQELAPGIPRRSMMKIAEERMRNVSLSAETAYQMPALPPASFDLRMGVMACSGKRVLLEEQALVGKVGGDVLSAALASGIWRDLEKSLEAAVSAPAKLADLISSYALNISPSGVNLVLQPLHAVPTHLYYRLAMAVLGMSYPKLSTSPSASSNMRDYLGQMQTQNVYVEVRRILADLKTLGDCSKVLGMEYPSTGKFWWEIFPTNLPCKSLSENGVLQRDFEALFNPTELPGVTQFESLKLSVALPLLRTVAIQHLQASLERAKESLRFVNHCFPTASGQQYIDTIMGSLHFSLVDSRSNISHVSRHPEPDFAAGGDSRYREGDGKEGVIFGMGGDPNPWRLLIGKGAEQPFGISRSAVRLKLPIRGLGCSINIYCAHPLTSPVRS